VNDHLRFTGPQDLQLGAVTASELLQIVAINQPQPCLALAIASQRTQAKSFFRVHVLMQSDEGHFLSRHHLGHVVQADANPAASRLAPIDVGSFLPAVCDANYRPFVTGLLAAGNQLADVGLVYWRVLVRGQVDHLDRIRFGMSPEEVSRMTAGWATMHSHCNGFPDPSFSPGQWFSESAAYEVGNGWMIELTFYDDKLGDKLLFYPQDPPLYRLAWHSLQERIPSLPDLPF
jgi:hypothetical protein